MTLVAKWLPTLDGQPEVLIAMPDGTIKYCINAAQLWAAVKAAASQRLTFTTYGLAMETGDWLANRLAGLDRARRDEATSTRDLISTFARERGVTVVKPARVDLPPPPKPKAKPPKVSKYEIPADLMAALDNLL